MYLNLIFIITLYIHKTFFVWFFYFTIYNLNICDRLHPNNKFDNLLKLTRVCIYIQLKYHPNQTSTIIIINLILWPCEAKWKEMEARVEKMISFNQVELKGSSNQVMKVYYKPVRWYNIF